MTTVPLRYAWGTGSNVAILKNCLCIIWQATLALRFPQASPKYTLCYCKIAIKNAIKKLF